MGLVFVVSGGIAHGISKDSLQLSTVGQCLSLWLSADCYFYFQTESGFSVAAGLPPLMCSSKIVDTSASVTLEYQVASG